MIPSQWNKQKLHPLASAITDYLTFVKLTRSENTTLTYSKTLKEFKKILVKAKIDPEKSSPTVITEELISRFILHLKSTAPATEQLYVGVVGRFYKHLVGEDLAEINLPRMGLLLKQYTRKATIRLPQFTQRYAHINDDELDKGYYDIFEKKE